MTVDAPPLAFGWFHKDASEHAHLAPGLDELAGDTPTLAAGNESERALDSLPADGMDHCQLYWIARAKVLDRLAHPFEAQQARVSACAD